jgi:protoheme IX farnesyltransferase
MERAHTGHSGLFLVQCGLYLPETFYLLGLDPRILADPAVLPIAAFFYVWQVPHFWLLILQYGREYESAGLPSLSGIMRELRIRQMIYLWILGTALITLFFTFSGPLDSILSKAGLWIASAWLIISFSSILRKSIPEFKPRKYFLKINYFVVIVMAFMCLDKIFMRYLAGIF